MIVNCESTAEALAAADAILAEYHVISRTPLPRTERPVCTFCGTWECSLCFYRRPNAVRFVEQYCPRDGCITGVFLETRHSNHYVYEDHLKALENYSATGRLRESMQQ